MRRRRRSPRPNRRNSQQNSPRRCSELWEKIEEEYPETQAVFVSGGQAYARDGEKFVAIQNERLSDYVDPYAWPIAHNVRPARQSLGATGCTECHSESSMFFDMQLKPVGLLPGQDTVTLTAADMQQADVARLSLWNRLFAGRSQFKIAGLAALGLTCLLVVSALAWNVGNLWRRG